MKSALDQKQEQQNDRINRRKFRLGEVEVRPRSGRIFGPAGERQLDPKVMDVLICLASSEGRVVSREFMMEKVWAGVIVTDFALSRCVYQLRKNLTEVVDSSDSPIETLPKRGYRLVWPVDYSSGDFPEKKKTFAISAGIAFATVMLLLAILAAQRESLLHHPVDQISGDKDIRLAIVPLESPNEESSKDGFAAGLTREISHELASLPGLIVVGRLSSGTVDFEGISSLAFGAQVNADYVLGGSIRSIGESRRVLLDLHRVSDGERLWSHSFLVESQAPFMVIRNVALATVDLFQFSVDSSAIKGSTDNLEAFELYLAALDTANVETQRQLLGRAVELDPEFAQAWNGLAAIEVMPVWNGQVSVGDAWQRAKPSIDKALAIDPALSSTYVTLGRFSREFGRMDEAIIHFRKALELEPGSIMASANLGLVLRWTGQYEEALAIHEMDALLDPLSALVQTRLGTSHWFTGDHDEAVRRYQKAVDLDPLNEEIYDSWSGMLSQGKGRFDQALEMIEKKMSIEAEPTVRSLAYAGNFANTLNLDSAAQAYWRQAEQLMPFNPIVVEGRLLHHLERSNDEALRESAESVLEIHPDFLIAHLALGILDMESGEDEQFVLRMEAAFPDFLVDTPKINLRDCEEALLLALAYSSNGRIESSDSLVDAVIEELFEPRYVEHLWLATAYAMQGNQAMALTELLASPAGKVRQWAAVIRRDPRFDKMQEFPGFHVLVDNHLKELDKQRALYISRHRSFSAVR